MFSTVLWKKAGREVSARKGRKEEKNERKK